MLASESDWTELQFPSFLMVLELCLRQAAPRCYAHTSMSENRFFEYCLLILCDPMRDLNFAFLSPLVHPPRSGGTQHANCASNSQRPDAQPDCVPGCVHQAGYCTELVTQGWCVCGKDWCQGRPQPWGPEHLETMLRQFQDSGKAYVAGGGFQSGYNEVCRF